MNKPCYYCDADIGTETEQYITERGDRVYNEFCLWCGTLRFGTVKKLRGLFFG